MMHRSFFVVMALSLLTSAAGFAQAQTQDSTPKLVTVSGSAEIQVDPTIATVVFSVITEDQTKKLAQASNATKSKALIDLLISKFQFTKADYRNSISSSTDNPYENGKYVFKGEIVTNTFTVRLHHYELPDTQAKLGSFLDTLADNDAKEATVSFGIEEKEAIEEQALALAALNARERAAVIVKAYGHTLGDIQDVTQSGASTPTYRAEAASARMALAPGGMPRQSSDVQSGQITVSASVTASFIVK